MIRKFTPSTEITVLKEATKLIKIPVLIEKSVRAFSRYGAHLILPVIWTNEPVRITIDKEVFTKVASPFSSSCHVMVPARFIDRVAIN